MTLGIGSEHNHSQMALSPRCAYTLVRRFSAKEERRCIVASVLCPESLPDTDLGFENHLNVFHAKRHGQLIDLAWGLAAYLNSSLVESWFRQFSGHTQVNATDLRALRYPDRTDLVTLGAALSTASCPDQQGWGQAFRIGQLYFKLLE